MEWFRVVLLAAFLVASTGCSAIVAAVLPDDDLSVLVRGAPREAVERELGAPEWTGRTARGLEVAYLVRVGQKHSWADNVDNIANVGYGVMREVGKVNPGYRTYVFDMAGAALAVPVMIGKDLLLSLKQIAILPKRRRRVVVLYDDQERLVTYQLSARS